MKKYSKYSDEELMQLIKRGKEAAFNELYRRYSVRMCRFFYNMLYQDEEKANDFTQELFLKIINRPDLFKPKHKFSSWFYAVATNMCKNEYRRNSRQPDIQPIYDNVNIGNNDFLKIEQQQTQELLQQAIANLPEPHKTCFVLRYQQELTIKQISEITNTPEGTVKARLHYATQKLAKRLKPILK